MYPADVWALLYWVAYPLWPLLELGDHRIEVPIEREGSFVAMGQPPLPGAVELRRRAAGEANRENGSASA